MFEITIKGETMEQLANNVVLMALPFSSAVLRQKPAPTGKPVASQPEVTATVEDAELERELNEPAPPMPATGAQVVDAGTGKPAVTDDEPIKMTIEGVKAAAAKLAGKDTPALAKILKGYDASKLSEVPKDRLADFATEVMEALG